MAETWYFLAAFVVNCEENGVRLTGGAFKGACVALIAASKAKAIAQDIFECISDNSSGCFANALR
ncbi:MAG TPA: hypothetical protein V6D26_31480 [Stenomitos sp.]